MIDVISIKKAVKNNELQFFVKNGNILRICSALMIPRTRNKRGMQNG